MVVDEFGREIPGARGRSPDGYDDDRGSSSRRRRRSSRSPPSRYSRGRSRSFSPSPPRSSSRRDESSPPKRFRHAVQRYVETPMLCEYLWKQQQEDDEKKQRRDSDASDGEGGAAKKDVTDATTEEENDEEKETYDDYRHHYCLTYVRSFFNQHLDDSWFRNRYSPLDRKRVSQEEMERAAKEAQHIQKEVEESLANKADDAEVCSFVQNARLGEGKKSSGIALTKKRKYDEEDRGGDGSEETVSVPKSHILSHIKDDSIIVIREVPPHVTEQQIYRSVADLCSKSPGSAIKVFSSSVSSNSSKSGGALFREAYVLCDNPQIQKDILTNLNKANYTARRIASPHHHHHAGDIPRKDEKEPSVLPKILDLDVECSDPYGRFEVDEDGKGGAPTSDDGVPKVPPRRATVMVLTKPEHQPVTVLSAAVSCQERIERDKEAAVMLARALDVARLIPRGVRLDDLLEQLFPQQQDGESSASAADVLDVSIAYLRRVHLFSFYNGCTMASGIGDVMSGNHASSTIHLRLKGADDILNQAKKETDEMYGDLGDDNTNKPAKDLLVMRLDDSISKALEQSSDWVSHAGAGVLGDETVDKDAAEIQELEEIQKAEWVENHGILDADARARCSFHFCRKLFKDKNFLRKHLIKKHGEFLRAEVAKCHDSFMMKSWDREANRPVPPVLVDCGAKFGMVLSNVMGAEHPSASDPEPELWRKEQERRQQLEEQQKRENERYSRDQHHRRGGDSDDRHNGSRRGDTGGGGDSRGGNFVDVDDVKVEKVELSFENVEVPIQPPKKKKKRKKLL